MLSFALKAVTKITTLFPKLQMFFEKNLICFQIPFFVVTNYLSVVLTPLSVMFFNLSRPAFKAGAKIKNLIPNIQIKSYIFFELFLNSHELS